MTSHFPINLKSPAQKVTEYVTVLKAANIPRINWVEMNCPSTCKGILKVNSHFFKCVLEDNATYRSLLYCAFVHPSHFARYGNIDSWYDTHSVCQVLSKRKQVYKYPGAMTLEKDVNNQLPFIRKIQNSNIDLKKAFPEISVQRYEQFMTLVKKYDGQYRLTPPVDVDFVWHAHMLDHKAYSDATKAYFGRLLDHDDSPKSQEEMKKQEEQTAQLWKKHFGSSASKHTKGGGTSSTPDDGGDDLLFWMWYYNHMCTHSHYHGYQGSSYSSRYHSESESTSNNDSSSNCSSSSSCSSSSCFSSSCSSSSCSSSD
jgi:hypothetical protein